MHYEVTDRAVEECGMVTLFEAVMQIKMTSPAPSVARPELSALIVIEKDKLQ
jgi:hypothetical protein